MRQLQIIFIKKGLSPFYLCFASVDLTFLTSGDLVLQLFQKGNTGNLNLKGYTYNDMDNVFICTYVVYHIFIIFRRGNAKNTIGSATLGLET